MAFGKKASKKIASKKLGKLPMRKAKMGKTPMRGNKGQSTFVDYKSFSLK